MCKVGTNGSKVIWVDRKRIGFAFSNHLTLSVGAKFGPNLRGFGIGIAILLSRHLLFQIIELYD